MNIRKALYLGTIATMLLSAPTAVVAQDEPAFNWENLINGALIGYVAGTSGPKPKQVTVIQAQPAMVFSGSSYAAPAGAPTAVAPRAGKAPVNRNLVRAGQNAGAAGRSALMGVVAAVREFKGRKKKAIQGVAKLIPQRITDPARRLPAPAAVTK